MQREEKADDVEVWIPGNTGKVERQAKEEGIDRYLEGPVSGYDGRIFQRAWVNEDKIPAGNVYIYFKHQF